MKLLFSLIILTQTIYARPIVILSGDANKKEIETIRKVISLRVGLPLLFIQNDFKNKKCIVQKESVLQLCFKHYKFNVAYQNRDALKNTLVKVIKNKKGLQTEDLGIL
jgi:hypothetical protein